ncbi:hypothetical protein EWM64_g4412 [Hericium alpestre]|uniref:Probable acetate kinase n=1 Tax=Hericium alpestre TaxID=135208 RepID=A0A4Y9ZXK1_9AGAM|nr:hypothetical protein EWM64_g4412 [Hericium alpestre]
MTTSKSGSGLILSLNSGSSSLKISLYRRVSAGHIEDTPDANPVTLLLISSIESISSEPTFSFSVADGDSISPDTRSVKNEAAPDIKDHATAFAHFLDYLKSEALIEREEIVHVCHRIVHGGDYFKPITINAESYHYIERLSDLAPLHNGAALTIIEACIEALPKANSIAYFDTAFHHYMPQHIRSCAINQEMAHKKGLRKYGFHGLSYAYILRAVARHLGKPPSETTLIVLHLGSGASACGIQAGKSLDTSMGLTPVSGLPGATRSGAIDPTLIFHYTHRAGRLSHEKSLARNVSVTTAEEILNTKAGWKALTGTADWRGVTRMWADGEPAGVLAFELFVDRILNYIGSYWLKMGGADKVDALVFSGGIGERSVELRKIVAEKCTCLGFAVDEGRNEGVDGVKGKVVEIGKEPMKVLVCRTDEQLEMARECALEPKFWQGQMDKS